MRTACLLSCVLVLGCDGATPVAAVDAGADSGSPDGGTGLAVLGGGSHSSAFVDVLEIVPSGGQLRAPSDLAFHPTEDHQLWITNRAGDSITIVSRTGASDQSISMPTAFGASHFLASPSALAFGDGGTFATIQDIAVPTQDTTPGDFMGPALWPADATLFDGGHPSHLDMLHNSPSGAGIAWDHGNAFWVYDGFHHAIAMYDFAAPHEPGGEDHSDGIIQRWVGGEMGYFHGVGSHMELDRESGLLYVADTEEARVVVLDTRSGEAGEGIGPDYDGAEMYVVNSDPLTTLIDSTDGLQQPSGLALRGGVLYITDHARNTIHAYGLDGTELDWIDLSAALAPASIGGIELDVEGRIYVTDTEDGRVVRIAPRI